MKDYLAIAAIFYLFGAALVTIIYLSAQRDLHDHHFATAPLLAIPARGDR